MDVDDVVVLYIFEEGILVEEMLYLFAIIFIDTFQDDRGGLELDEVELGVGAGLEKG